MKGPGPRSKLQPRGYRQCVPSRHKRTCFTLMADAFLNSAACTKCKCLWMNLIFSYLGLSSASCSPVQLFQIPQGDQKVEKTPTPPLHHAAFTVHLSFNVHCLLSVHLDVHGLFSPLAALGFICKSCGSNLINSGT